MSKMEQGKCPLCGGGLNYEPSEYDDECELTKWRCENCGATGTEVCDIKFAFHQDVRDAEGNPVQIQVPSDMFWVSWIEQDSQGRVCSLGVNEAFMSLERAMKEVKWREENYGEKLISVWVERHNGGKKIDIPFHRFYVGPFGARIKIETPVLVKYMDDATGKIVEVRYDSVEELKREYWSDKIDMNVPANDANVIFASVDGIRLDNISDFESVIVALGIDAKE